MPVVSLCAQSIQSSGTHRDFSAATSNQQTLLPVAPLIPAFPLHLSAPRCLFTSSLRACFFPLPTDQRPTALIPSDWAGLDTSSLSPASLLCPATHRPAEPSAPPSRRVLHSSPSFFFPTLAPAHPAPFPIPLHRFPVAVFLRFVPVLIPVSFSNGVRLCWLVLVERLCRWYGPPHGPPSCACRHDYMCTC